MNDEQLLLGAMRSSRLFWGVSDHVISRAAEISLIQRHKANVLLRQAAEPVGHLMLIVIGVLEFSRTTVDGRRLVMRLHGPGEVGDLIPAMDGGGSVFDVRTHVPTTVALLPTGTFRELVDSDIALQRNVCALLCDRGRYNYQLAEQLMAFSLRQRIATSLLGLASVCGRAVAEGVEIQLKISQDDLAAILSASRQRINAELRWFVREGVIATRYSRITILDHYRLADIAGLVHALHGPGLQAAYTTY